jgi:hypothetical protein
VASGVRGCLNSGADLERNGQQCVEQILRDSKRAEAYDNEQAANEDANLPSVAIGEETTEWEGRDLSAVVYDEDDASAATSTTQAEGFLIAIHGINGAHQGRVEAVHGRNEVSNGHLPGRQHGNVNAQPVDMQRTYDHVQPQHALAPYIRLLSIDGSSQGAGFHSSLSDHWAFGHVGVNIANML